MQALFLFLILLFGLILCSILGGKYKEGYTGESNSIIPINSNMNPMGIDITANTNENYDNYNHYQKTTPNTITSSQYFGSTGTPVINPLANMPANMYTNVPTNMPANMPANMPTNSQLTALPSGIPQSQITPGNEDLYILKSEVVPPVCPVCPSLSFNSSNKKKSCPPCPACARCPQPSFECKKVPNYNAINNSEQPVPVLNDFSSFGM